MFQFLPVVSTIDLHGRPCAISCRLDRRTLVIPLGYTGPRSPERPGSTESVEGVVFPGRDDVGT